MKNFIRIKIREDMRDPEFIMLNVNSITSIFSDNIRGGTYLYLDAEKKNFFYSLHSETEIQQLIKYATR